ncbi:helix-turn-helix domain-containing protein [Aestuariivivens sediminicola]|uniref:helix-turn-helix domain-containing protein n=1 Tax=Aestuariivivens sediminicola TaxID=2913560 RepID=UPI00374CB2FC
MRKDIKKISGLSLIAFQNKVQLELACEMLLNRNDLTINQISKAVGFRDTKYFSKKFKTRYGLVPSVYRGKFKNS